MESLSCSICLNTADNTTIEAREMMFGHREPFTYVVCGSCGCMRLVTPPTDWAPYYPTDYYAFAPTARRPESVARRFGKRALVRHAMGEPSVMGSLLSRRWRSPHFIEWMRQSGTGRNDSILDVGCGNGSLLQEMAAGGFTNLTGVDPFIAADATPAPGVRILKRELADVEGQFKLVMMHHAFEHMPDPDMAIRESARLLVPNGHLLIRIPLAGTYAARTYGTDWVQLDAPRHHVLHTEQSIALLAEQAGFAVETVIYDSSSLQFWGSEQYRMGIPLMDVRSHFAAPTASPFSPDEIAAFQHRAETLNAAGDGDQAAFYLRKR